MKCVSAIGKPIGEDETVFFRSRSDSTESSEDERFDLRMPEWSLDDMILNAETAQEIDSVCAKVEYHSVLYEQWGLARIDPHGNRVAVSLYGPPGTGKTMCAEALARRFGKPILEVDYADVESKYVGETPKNIRAAFKKAEESGALLFFDEADSILGKRMTTVTQSADHSVNVSRAVMLRQMDLFSGIVVFATNLARNYDAAFVRRIPYHIYMPLPDEAGRRRLWDRLVPVEMPGRDELDTLELVRSSDGLSGGDIKNVVILAATRAVQRKGDSRRITTDDLSQALESVIKAKRDVGAVDNGVVDIREVPVLAQHVQAINA